MLALNVGVSVALQDILTREDRSYSLTMWGVVTMNRVVATIILRLIISRTIPMPTAMMIGDIKHQSKSAGKRKLFQLSLIASWWSKHCMAIMSILCTDTFQRSLAKKRGDRTAVCLVQGRHFKEMGRFNYLLADRCQWECAHWQDNEV